MGMPITIIRTIFQIGKRTLHLGIPSPDLVGSVYMALQQAQQFILWRKTLHQSAAELDSHVWGFFRSMEVIREQKPLSIINMLKKEQPFAIMFPSGSRHSQDVKGGVAIIAKMAKVMYHASDLYWSRETWRKVDGLGERIDMNFGHPVIFRILKMNDEEWQVARRIQRSLISLGCGSRQSTPQQE